MVWVCDGELRNGIFLLIAFFCLTYGNFTAISEPMRTEQKTKKIALSDWHPADIVAAIWKTGWALRKRAGSLRSLAIKNGYAAGSLKKALRVPWPKAEQIIADELGLPPWAIWPSRYDAKGKPNRGGPGPKPKLRMVKK